MSTKAAKKKNTLLRIAAVATALVLWQAAAWLLDSNILLAGPLEVLGRFPFLLRETDFLPSLWFSFSRIIGGFLLALLLGTALAALAGRFRAVDIFLAPYMVTIKTVPVASFIILALLWLSSAGLSVFISFLMVLPIIYTNVLSGIRSIDPKMEEAARLFRVPWLRRVLYLWLPSVKPYLLSACSVALGLSWKAGVAAEVIGVPSGSVGEAMYVAKVHLDMVDLLCWTVVIVAASLLFEKLFLALMRALFRGLERI